jgi:hypothetical protein
MEEWAAWYARESYTPFWAGSHLFLADRFTGQFSKNSELYQGFLTDSTVFGASNRFYSLVQAPGQYAKLEAYAESKQWKQYSLIGTVNGLSVEPFPVSYFVSGDVATARSRDDPSTGTGGDLTVGLGARPTQDFGVFSFFTDTRVDAKLRMPSQGLNDDRLRQTNLRGDIGFNVKLAAQNQLWFKAGTGSQESEVSGVLVSQGFANSLNRLFSTSVFTANGTLDRYHATSDGNEFQFRQSVGSDAYTLSWGLEQSRLNRPGEFTTTFTPVRLRFTEEQKTRSTDAYVSLRWRDAAAGAVSVQGDLWAQRSRVDRLDHATLDVLAPVLPQFVLQNTPATQNLTELNPRLGVTWRFLPTSDLRLVGQRWRRPASVSTLGPVDTEGVAVDDRMTMEGGLYRRGRLQFDHETPGRFFLQAFGDHERVNNGVGGAPSVVPAIDLTALEDLRVKRDVFTAVSDLEATPIFVEGRVTTYGFAGNILLDHRNTVSLRYLRRDEHQTGANAGLHIPYLPRDYLRAASQWTFPDRWLLGASAIYRGRRFRDDLNTLPIAAGWSFGLTAYWESLDKRHSVQGILDNLLPDKSAGFENHPRMTARYAFRF